MLSSYIDSQIIDAENQLHLYTSHNKTNLPKRDAFPDLLERFERFGQGETSMRWVLMSGLRGVGKTTMLAQFYFHILSAGVPRARVLYATMDSVRLNLGVGLNDLVKAYEKKLLVQFEDLHPGEEVYLLLDEVQQDPDWALAIKVLFDRSRRVFILATGSSTLALTSTADTARRAAHISLEPLTFGEFVRLDQGTEISFPMAQGISNAIFTSKTSRESLELLLPLQEQVIESLSQGRNQKMIPYLRTGTLPPAMGLDPHEAFALINGTLDKVIDQDLAVVHRFDRSTLIKAHQLLTSLAVADRISHEALCTNLGINNRTLIELIDSIEAAGIIQRVRPFGSESTRLRKTPKYKFVAPAMRVALLAKIGRWGDRPAEFGHVFEDVAMLYLRRWVKEGMIRGFDYVIEEGRSDLVIRRNDDRPLIMELSWGHKGTEQVERTMRDVGSNLGVLVADTPLGLSEDERILRLPRSWFLLSS